jgi:hypothetical protein
LYANKSRLGEPRLRKEDLIYLLRRNIKTIKLNDKLDLKKIGPFKVKRNIRDINFEFKFLLIIRIHSIFYILLLESAYFNIPEGPVPKLDLKI